MLREATDKDVEGLLTLDRAANLAALGHVFPQDRYPFPEARIRAQWREMVADSTQTVLITEDAEALTSVVVYGKEQVHKLAVHPDHWGQGLATRALEAALDAMRQIGTTSAWLWCLEENPRARRLYERLGWQTTGDRETSKWPPYPVMLRYTRPI